MHDIAIAHDVFLAFQPHLAGLLGAVLAFVFDEFVESDHFGANKTFFEIGVDDARRLRRSVALVHGPRAHFFRPDGEVGLQAQQFVGRADQAVESRFLHADVGQKHIFVFVRQIGDFGFERGADRDHRRMLGGGIGLDLVEQRIVLEPLVVDVGDVNGGLGRHQTQRFQQHGIFFFKLHAAHRLALVELRAHLFEQSCELDRLLVAGLGGLARALHRFFDGLQIG